MGAFGMPEIYSEAKKAQDIALRESYPVILEVWKEWGKLTGRNYDPVETYRMEGAKIGPSGHGEFLRKLPWRPWTACGSKGFRWACSSSVSGVPFPLMTSAKP